MAHKHTLEFSDIEGLVNRFDSSRFTFEYNCSMRRIYPWHPYVETKRNITEFGVIWVEVHPETEVEMHQHDEEETFILTSGRAEIIIESQKTILNAGDVVYIPRYCLHQICNPFEEKLVFIDIFWDFKGRSKEVFLMEKKNG